VEVEHEDVGPVPLDLGGGRRHVAGLGHDLDARL
jgi:hypothetical protein